MDYFVIMWLVLGEWKYETTMEQVLLHSIRFTSQLLQLFLIDITR